LQCEYSFEVHVPEEHFYADILSRIANDRSYVEPLIPLSCYTYLFSIFFIVFHKTIIHNILH